MEATATSQSTTSRWPLADLTNTTPSAVTCKPSCSSARRAATAPASHGDDAMPMTAPRSKAISPIPDGNASTHDRGHSVVYSIKSKVGKKSKGKALAAEVASSSPPFGRIKTIKRELNMENNQLGLSKEICVPCQKVKVYSALLPLTSQADSVKEVDWGPPPGELF